MAHIIFAKAIYKQEIINLNNFGNMSRDLLISMTSLKVFINVA